MKTINQSIILETGDNLTITFPSGAQVDLFVCREANLMDMIVSYNDNERGFKILKDGRLREKDLA